MARKCIHLNEKSLVDGKPFCYTLGHACVGPEYCGWYSPKPYNKDGKEEKDGKGEEECSDKCSSFPAEAAALMWFAYLDENENYYRKQKRTIRELIGRR